MEAFRWSFQFASFHQRHMGQSEENVQELPDAACRRNRKQTCASLLAFCSKPAFENWIIASLSGDRLRNTTSAPSRPQGTIAPRMILN